MKFSWIGIGLISLLPTLALAQTGYTITGYMSNFDCTNRCDYPCDELEIDIEGIHPEDVVHTYHNGNYGAPTVTLSDDGTYTVIDYRNPQHLTAINSIEHYGVTIRGAVYYGPAPDHPVRVRWYRDGHPATVNGQIPNPDSGGTAPATQPLQPSIIGSITSGSHGQGGVMLSVKNNDPTQAIWVKRRAQITQATVSLEALMPNDPVVTTTVQIDSGPVFLGPLQTLSLLNDFFEVESEQTAVFAAEYFQNLVGGGPFSQNTPGPMLGNVMTATLATPQLACAHSMPTIMSQPTGVTQAEGSRIDLRVQARGDDLGALEYLWMKEGVALVDGNGVSGATSSHLRIDHLTAATEGFYSVRIRNVCATIISDSALVFITGHNAAPVRTVECPTIVTQPVGATGCSQMPAVFAVGTGGTDPLHYQWKCMSSGGVACGNLADGLYSDAATGLRYNVAGATTGVLTISDIDLGTHASQLMFAVDVSNACGSVSSDVATMQVVQYGDTNCDCTINNFDIDPFVQALIDPAGYSASFPTCDVRHADANRDGAVNNFDIDAFVACIVSGCP